MLPDTADRRLRGNVALAEYLFPLRLLAMGVGWRRRG